ncbi:MAG: glyoxalase [Sneathiella sp.]|nr:MAG: glyoxalase [Sneathiella sp.]
MIGYATLGTNDLERASGFYDALLAEIGATRIMADDHITVWGTKPGNGMLAVIKPYNGEKATVGNGSMAAILVDNPETVSKLHAKALSLGGADEGAPGPRGSGQMDFGYCRDLEGHKLAFYCMNKRA